MKKSNEAALEICRYISLFITDYVPSQITNSVHTLRAFETTLTIYVNYLESVCKIKPENLSCTCFERECIEGWLKWMSTERNCSPNTCNNRLACLRTFLKYLASRNLKYQYLSIAAGDIPRRKTIKNKVNGLSKSAVKTILAQPDMHNKSGIRDETFLVTLYGTAARLDELLSLKVSSLHLDEAQPYVIIRGKGDKIRTIYLLQKSVDHLRNYLKIFHGDSPALDSFVFYSRNKGPQGKLSQSAIRKMLRRYALPAHEENNEVPLDLHAHQFRHARASHWLEEGMNIVQISLLLGHEHLETTMIYLDITIEQKADALATLEDETDKITVPKWNPDKDSLASLCGLRKLRK